MSPRVVLSVLLVLCSGTSASCARSRTAGSLGGALPADYESLDLPQRSIPIGARWRPGVGPDGPGVPETDLLQVESLAYLSSNHEFATNAEIALADYFGITGEIRRVVNIDISGLTIVRPETMALSVGDMILYEGLKAARITLTYDMELDASIKAKISTKGIPVVVESATNARQSVTLDGTDLFIGYRVVEMVGGRQRRWQKKMLFDSGELRGYEMRLDTKAVESCMCGAEDWPSRAQCTEDVAGTLYVTNFDRLSSDGSPYEQSFEAFGQAHPGGGAIMLSSPVRNRLSLGMTTIGSKVSSQFLVVSSEFTAVNLGHGCFLVAQSEVELIASTFRLRSKPSPSAPGY